MHPGLDLLKKALGRLEHVLRQHGDVDSASLVRQALESDDKCIHEFLVSNELWGGMGSIADQAGCENGREVRRQIEAELIRLGTEQIRLGLVNPRTERTVAVFSEWQREGI